MKFKWDGRFFVCNGICFKVNVSMYIRERPNNGGSVLIPFCVEYSKCCNGIRVFVCC
jgi:hypothetical protein